MKHLKSNVFHKSGSANNQHTYQYVLIYMYIHVKEACMHIGDYVEMNHEKTIFMEKFNLLTLVFNTDAGELTPDPQEFNDTTDCRSICWALHPQKIII